MALVNLIVDAVAFVIHFVLPFFVVLGIIAFVHELGHFLVGRWCGARVEAFSIGIGPELVGRTDRHGTRWRLSAFPIGGYVRFAGDSNAASGTDNAALSQMSDEERRTTLAGLPLASRAATVAAGPFANFLMAFVIFSGLSYVNGQVIVRPLVDGVVAGSPAEKAGFQKGDEIRAVDGHAVTAFSDLVNFVSIRPGEAMTFKVERAREDLDIVATPASTVIDTIFGKQSVGRLGISASTAPQNVQIVALSPLGAMRAGLGQCVTVVGSTFDYLGRVFAGHASTDQLSGPVRIAQASASAASFGPMAFAFLLGLISLSIGLTNLLPVPILDGGHLVFYAIEALRGRPLGVRAQEIGLRIGAAFVLALMVLATFSDLRRLFIT